MTFIPLYIQLSVLKNYYAGYLHFNEEIN